MQSPARVNILGVGVSAIDIKLALEIIDFWITQRKTTHYVCVTGVHGIMESQKDEPLRQIHNKAGLVTPDGMPLVWLSHLKGLPHVKRVYGPDLMLALCEQSVSKGYRHYLYGGAEGVAQRLAANLCQNFPGLQIAGLYSPPFRPLSDDEDAQVVQMINKSAPDVVWVGLGTPKQERWMATHVERLKAPILIGVGAAFDFHAGLKKQAPPWMQRAGLEWSFRLRQEPRRLWQRYLVNNPLFVMLIMAQILGFKRYSLE